MTYNSDQEKFWAEQYASDYIKNNEVFNHELGVQAWAIILNKVQRNISSILECGCNIGRNIEQLNRLIPESKKSVIEISEPAFNFVTQKYDLFNAFHGSIIDSKFEEESFDLVFTLGVLIHINPDQLLMNMKKMYEYSSKYILIGEYFNRTPISIEYHGEQERLFKRDFGKLFVKSFDCKLIDYGFLWGHIYDSAGFDDITWWLFEKEV
tara:strand:- start:61 stop:687 length:627 start_codon:yes stop_codon:yes gene_type:complete